MMKSRTLTAKEINLFPPSFIGAIDIASVRLIGHAHNPFAKRKILVRNNDIYWPNYPDDFSQGNLEAQSLLMHELCHVWQYHTGRLTALRYLLKPSNWVYKYSFSPAKTFDAYPIERQADLLQDWYRLNMGALPLRYADGTPPPELSEINRVIPFIWDLPGAKNDKTNDV